MSLSSINNLAPSTPVPAFTAPTPRPAPAVDSVTRSVKSTPVSPNAPVSSTENTSAVQRNSDDAQLDRAISNLNKFLKPVASSVEFSIDEKSGRTLVKVVDTDTQTVLRQFPSKEALAISESLDRFQGLLLRDKA